MTVLGQAYSGHDDVLPGLLSGTLAVIQSSLPRDRTMLALQLSACVSVGRSMWGLLPADPKPGPVIYVAAGDPEQAFAHWLHDIMSTPLDGGTLGGVHSLHDNLHLLSVYGTDFHLGQTSGSGFEPSPDLLGLRDELLRVRPRLLVLDDMFHLFSHVGEGQPFAQAALWLERLMHDAGAACLILSSGHDPRADMLQNWGIRTLTI